MELKSIKANFLGDSITQGCGTSSPDKVFHALIKEKYGLAEARNYGKGGTRIARQSEIKDPDEPRDKDFILRAEDMDPDADLIVVFGGTNDYGHGDAKLGVFDDKDDYTFYGALHNLAKYLASTFPKDKICFILPIPRFDQNNPYGDGSKDEAGVSLQEYIKAEIKTLDFYGVEYLDLSDKFYIPNTQQDDGNLYADGLHPNAKGHRFLADCLIEYLTKKGL